jgi:hypothetical protein
VLSATFCGRSRPGKRPVAGSKVQGSGLYTSIQYSISEGDYMPIYSISEGDYMSIYSISEGDYIFNIQYPRAVTYSIFNIRGRLRANMRCIKPTAIPHSPYCRKSHQGREKYNKVQLIQGKIRAKRNRKQTQAEIQFVHAPRAHRRLSTQ